MGGFPRILSALLYVLQASFVMSLVVVLFVICAIILILIILIQRGRGGGLGAALGAGLPSGILGSKTGDFLTWVTIVLAGIFLTLAVIMAKYYKPSVGGLSPGSGQGAVPTRPADLPEQPLSVPPISDEMGTSGGEQKPLQDLPQALPSAEVNDVNVDTNSPLSLDPCNWLFVS